MKIGLTSDEVNLIDMSTIAYWKIRARLLRVPGVAQVAIWGERLPQRHVQVDPAKLAEHDVTLQQVMDTAADALDAGLLRYSDGAVIGTGGFVESGDSGSTSGTSSRSSTRTSSAQVPVVERDGKTRPARRPGQRARRPRTADRGRRHQRRPRPACWWSRSSAAPTPWRSPAASRRPWPRCSPGCRASTIDTTIFRPATFIEQSIDNLTRRC